MKKYIIGGVLALLLIAVSARLLTWALEPALPALLIIALLVIVYTAIFRRKW